MGSKQANSDKKDHTSNYGEDEVLQTFQSLDHNQDGTISPSDLANALELAGLVKDDPRVSMIYKKLLPHRKSHHGEINFEIFKDIIKGHTVIVQKAVIALMKLPLIIKSVLIIH